MNWKNPKIQALILGIAGLTIIAFSIISTYSLITPKQKTIPASPSLVPTSTPTVAPRSAWQIYKDVDYSIGFPPQLKATPAGIDSGGRSLTLKPGDNSYTIELQIVPGTGAEFTKTANVFRAFNYPETPASVGRQVAKRFVGSMKPASTTIQETAVIVEYKGQLYKFQLNYKASSRDKVIDGLFAQILATFRFLI